MPIDNRFPGLPSSHAEMAALRVTMLTSSASSWHQAHRTRTILPFDGGESGPGVEAERFCNSFSNRARPR